MNDPDPAAELFAYFGVNVEQEMEEIRRGAIDGLRWFRDPQHKKRTELNRFVTEAEWTCVAFSQPPPAELVELGALLRGADCYPRADEKHRPEWRVAARFLAAHPRASNRKVAREAAIDDKTVAKWKGEHSFRRRILVYKQLAKQDRKKNSPKRNAQKTAK